MREPPVTAKREAIRVLVFSASLRAESLNTRLAKLAARVIEDHGGTVDLAAMSEFDCPSYNQDAQATGFPPGAEQFRSRLEDVDAFVIASPEYNGSLPGVLKNAVDWVSRYKPQPFNAKQGMLISASHRWSAATAASGPCACRSSISARACTRTCFHSPRPTRHSPPTARSPTRHCRIGSTRRSSDSSIWSKPPSTIRAPRRPGSSFWESTQTRQSIASSRLDALIRSPSLRVRSITHPWLGGIDAAHLVGSPVARAGRRSAAGPRRGGAPRQDLPTLHLLEREGPAVSGRHGRLRFGNRAACRSLRSRRECR